MGGAIGLGFTVTTRQVKGVAIMRKMIVIAFLVGCIGFMGVSLSEAALYNQDETGLYNVEAQGNFGSPGYFKFMDGNGTALGYLWMAEDPVTKKVTLRWTSASQPDFTLPLTHLTNMSNSDILD